MIRLIYEVDPLVCPRCGETMRIVAFIPEPNVIRKILSHLAVKQADGRSTWNLSNRMLAFGAWVLVEFRNAFHMSIRAMRVPELFLGPRHLKTRPCWLGAILAPKPDRPFPDQAADHDPIGVSLLDRDLIDADHLRCRTPRAAQLFPHVLLLEVLHRVPVEVQLFGNVLDRVLVPKILTTSIPEILATPA